MAETEQSISGRKNREPRKYDAESAHHFNPHSDDARFRRAEMSARHSPTNKLTHRTKHFLKSRRGRNIFYLGLVILLAIIMFVPPLKYGILNRLGVRATVNVTILDLASGLPLREVDVAIGESTALTDKNGIAEVKEVKLGSQVFTVEKIAYEAIRKSITVSAGTNNLEDLSLNPVGVQLEFNVKDWLSGTAIEGATLSYQTNSVYSAADGTALLTIPPQSEPNITITISAPGYRSESLDSVVAQTAPVFTQLVISTKHIFARSVDGVPSLYKIDADGKNEEMLLQGSGNEGEDLQLLVTKGRFVYLVSSRKGEKTADNKALYELYLIDSESSELTQIEQAPSIRLYGIARDLLIYSAVDKEAVQEATERESIYSYEPITGQKTKLVSSNFFNSVLVAEPEVFYAPSDYYKTDRMPFLFRVDPITGDKSVVHPQEVWTIFRSGVNSITFDAKQDWYSLDLAADSEPLALSTRPDNLSSRIYEPNLSGSKSAWIDFSLGVGNLKLHDDLSSEETSLYQVAGLKYPLRFLDENHIVFRVSTADSTADFILDLRGGTPTKITDVSDVPSYDRWYYY